MASQTYPVTKVPQEITDSVVKRFRLIAHKYNTLLPGLNYWTIDLVCNDKSSVRLHMKLEDSRSTGDVKIITCLPQEIVDIGYLLLWQIA
ncbi:hypothetical protein B7494_g5314 [Chlorociboria aeruginascens]|nr:hypothetical protein B7494_g5314 [Chlorociboria aeruginascens]